MKNSTIKRIIILILAIALLVGSVFIIRSCNAPPEYSEIEARFKELINNSHDVNVILFGDGLDLYPKVYETSHTFTDTDGNKYYYYIIEDENFGSTVYRYRRTESLFYYASDEKLEGKEHIYLDANGSYYYEIEDYDQGEKKATLSKTPFKDGDEEYLYYTIEDESYGTVYKYNKATVSYYASTNEEKPGKEPIYVDSENGLYYYEISYIEPEFYYSSADPENYGYVKDDAKCTSIAQIKALAERVYSKSYLCSLYEPLFDGFEAVPAKFYEDGTSGRLMQYKNYESLFNLSCVYMFETAEIDTWQSNSSLVRINIKAYLPSEPDVKYDVVIDLAYEDGNWYLETPTYIANLE